MSPCAMYQIIMLFGLSFVFTTPLCADENNSSPTVPNKQASMLHRFSALFGQPSISKLGSKLGQGQLGNPPGVAHKYLFLSMASVSCEALRVTKSLLFDRGNIYKSARSAPITLLPALYFGLNFMHKQDTQKGVESALYATSLMAVHSFLKPRLFQGIFWVGLSGYVYEVGKFNYDFRFMKTFKDRVRNVKNDLVRIGTEFYIRQSNSEDNNN